jgi:hypothetical protein
MPEPDSMPLAVTTSLSFLWSGGNDSGRLTFTDSGKSLDTLSKHQRIQGFRGDAAAINVIFRT